MPTGAEGSLTAQLSSLFHGRGAVLLPPRHPVSPGRWQSLPHAAVPALPKLPCAARKLELAGILFCRAQHYSSNVLSAE